MDQTLVPAEPAKVNVRQAQVLKVLQFMTEGHTQGEACALAGISQRTYQRWVSKPEFRNALQQLAQASVTAAFAAAFNALPEAVSYQALIATGQKGDPRDANKAAVFLRDLTNKFLEGTAPARRAAPDGQIVPPEEGETSVTVTFTPNFARKKVEVETQVQQAGPVVEGQVTEVQSDEGTE